VIGTLLHSVFEMLEVTVKKKDLQLSHPSLELIDVIGLHCETQIVVGFLFESK